MAMDRTGGGIWGSAALVVSQTQQRTSLVALWHTICQCTRRAVNGICLDTHPKDASKLTTVYHHRVFGGTNNL